MYQFYFAKKQPNTLLLWPMMINMRLQIYHHVCTDTDGSVRSLETGPDSYTTAHIVLFAAQ